MALTGMEIYKLLPKTNCKDCGLPTCMAFAMQVAAKQKALGDCPHVSDEAQEELSAASAPPMKMVKVGPEGRQFEMGQETVMFRHEEKFHHPTGIAVRVPASLSDDEAAEKVKSISEREFVRVGDTLQVSFAGIEVDGVDDPAARVKAASEAGSMPLIIIGSDTEAVQKAADALKDTKPLIYKADASSIDAFADIAVSVKAPLAVSADSLDECEELTQKAKDKGVEEMVLAFEGNNAEETLKTLTIARRAALKKSFRALGYPAMVQVNAESAEKETYMASVYAAKYASIVLIDGDEPWELLPIMATVQNIYTDPQVPNTVEAKLYEIGDVNENSPVMFTTNFSLTYFSVAGEVERSKIPTYISVVETEGLGVLNAYAGDKIKNEKV